MHGRCNFLFGAVAHGVPRFLNQAHSVKKEMLDGLHAGIKAIMVAFYQKFTILSTKKVVTFLFSTKPPDSHGLN